MCLNKDYVVEWVIDVYQDFYKIFLFKFNLVYNDLFEVNIILFYFECLCKECFVYLCEESQYGFYWLVIKYDDIMYVDINYKLFLLDIMNGGIWFGGEIFI